MAEPNRFSVEAILRATDYQGKRVTFSHRVEGDHFKVLHLTVPAGKSAMQEIVRSAWSPPGEPVVKGLYIESDVEGVEFWPIRQPLPADYILSDPRDPGHLLGISMKRRVDPDTKIFGWLFPMNAPSFVHTHGTLSALAPNHSSTGSALFHDNVFPVWQEYEEDRTAWDDNTYYLGNCFTDEIDVGWPNPIVGRGGRCFDLSLKQLVGIPGPTRTQQLLLGYQPGQYWNLGTLTDDLWFTFVYYLEKPVNTSVTYPSIGLWCYPYTTNLIDPDLVPTTTPQGRTTWGVDDLHLCRRNIDPTTGNTLGWNDSASSLGPHFSSNSAINFAHTTGWQARSTGKTAWTQFGRGSETLQFSEGDFAMNRVTMASLNLQGTAAQDAYLANVYFGPRPGRRHTLRPFFYLGFDLHAPYLTPGSIEGASATPPVGWTFWDMGRNDPYPTIGFQNPTSKDAVIKIILCSEQPESE